MKTISVGIEVPRFHRWVGGLLSLALFAVQSQILAYFILFPPSAHGAPSGTSTVSAGSAPPPAATTVESFQPDLFTGRATTGFPIVVPPGRQGIQPELGLSYSSAGGNGWLGVGWSLDMGYIERSLRHGTPKYDATDTFALVFQSVNADLAQIADGTYRAKSEGMFLRVANLGATGWEVRDKTGTRYLFGQTIDSRVANGTDVFRWHLDKVIDTHGNSMTISYQKFENQPYLHVINYTAHEATALLPSNQVEFFLEDRPDIFGNSRPGFNINTTKRLASIETRAKISGSYALARKYALTYEVSQRTGRSLLKTITQFGHDGVTSLPPVTYQYSHVAQPTYAISSNAGTHSEVAWRVRVAGQDTGHENFGAVPPYSGFPYGSPVTISGGQTQSISGVTAIVGTNGSIQIHGGRDYFVHAFTAVFMDAAGTISLAPTGSWDVAALWVEQSGSPQMIPYHQMNSVPLNAGWTILHLVGYHQHSSFSLGFTNSLASQVALIRPTVAFDPQMAGDVDGNAIADLVSFDGATGVWTVSTAEPSGISPGTNWLSGFGDGASSPLIGDFNADGRIDVATFKDGVWNFATSNGSQFTANGMAAVTFGQGAPTVGDFNGDGKMDLATFREGQWRFALGTGSGFNPAPAFDHTVPQGVTTFVGHDVRWSAAIASHDCGHDNYGLVPPNSATPCGFPNFSPTVKVSGTVNVNGVNVSVDGQGNIVVPAGQDRHFHVSCAVYNNTAKNISLTETNSWDVAGLFIESGRNPPTHHPNASFGSIPLAAGWTILHITGYHQHDSITCGLAGNPVSKVDVFSPVINEDLLNRPQQLTADWNGDGLTDVGIVKDGVLYRRLSNGLAFVSMPNFTLPFTAKEISTADFNGDGLSDLSYLDRPNGKVKIAYNNGTTFNATVNLPVTFTLTDNDAQIQFGDFNGDGLPDPAVFNAVTGDSQLAFSSGEIPDVMTGIVDGVGGTTTIKHVRSNEIQNTLLPFVVPIVTRVDVSDGLGHTYTSTYAYSSGLFDKTAQEFRGFGRVEVRNAEGTVNVTEFHQDAEKKGQPRRSEVRDAFGNLWAATEQTYTVIQPYAGIADAKFVPLTRTDNFIYDGDTSFRQVNTRVEYDSHGNVTATYDDGETGVAGDEKSVHTTYNQNVTAWILSTPKQVESRDAAGNTVTRARYFYDGAASIDTAPVRGGLTREEAWLNLPTEKWIPVTRVVDAYGNVTSTTNAKNQTTTNTYDATRTFVTQVSNALGHTVQSTYDPRNGSALTNTDANGVASTTVYDVLGRVVKIVGPLDTVALPTVAYTYDLASFPTRTIVEARIESGQAAVLTSYAFTDGLGRQIQRRSPGPTPAQQIVTGATEFTSTARVDKQWVSYFEAFSATYVAPVTSALAAPYLYQYDPVGRLRQTTTPDGRVSRVDYADWTVTATDANGHQSRYVEDARGRRVRVEEINGAETYVTTFLYDQRDNVSQVVDTLGNTTFINHDSLGRKLSMTDPDMGSWSYVYDDLGNLVSQTDARGVSTNFNYDSLNRVLSKSHTIPVGANVAPTAPALYVYDDPARPNSVGRITQVGDGSGTVVFSYDILGRLTSSTRTVDSIGYTFGHTYDLLGRPKTLSYPNGQSVSYGYSPIGIETITLHAPSVPPSNIVTNVDYNAAGQLTRIEYGNGVVSDFTYNPLNLRLEQLVTQGPGGPLQNFAYTFDGVGNISQITDTVHSASQTFQYDPLDRLTQAVGSSYGTASYAYNAIGNMTQKEGTTLNYPASGPRPHAVTSTSKGLSLTYDANGNLTAKAAAGRGTKRFKYDAENRMVEAVVPEQVKLKPGWQLVSFPQVRAPTAIGQVLDAFGADYEQLTRVSTGASSLFESHAATAPFDQFSKIEPGKAYWLFAKDKADTALTITGSTSSLPSRNLAAGWHLLPGPSEKLTVAQWLSGLSAGADYDLVQTYDAQASAFVTATEVEPGRAYAVRVLRPVVWTPPAPTHPTLERVNQYVYDSAGARLKKITRDGTTLYLGDAYEVAPNGNATVHIFAGGHRVAAHKSNGDLHFFHSDHLGSSNLLTNRQGQVIRHIEYSPYGATSRSEGNPALTEVQYTGQRLDEESGLYFYNARYYDPEIGRFIQADTIVPNPSNPQDLNRYAYTNNNPVNYVDPSGHWSVKSLIGGLVGGIIGFTKSGERFFKKHLSTIISVAGVVLAPVTGGASLWISSLINTAWSGIQAARTGQLAAWAVGAAVSMLVGAVAPLNFSNIFLQVGASAVRGAMTGALVGGITSTMAGGSFGAGAKSGAMGGAIGGAISGFLSSQQFENWTKGHGFRSRGSVINSFAKEGKYQEAIDYAIEAYGIKDAAGAKCDASMKSPTVGETDLVTAQVTIGPGAFKNPANELLPDPSNLVATLAHESVHVLQVREWQASHFTYLTDRMDVQASQYVLKNAGRLNLSGPAVRSERAYLKFNQDLPLTPNDPLHP